MGKWKRLDPEPQQEAALVILQAARNYDTTRPALPYFATAIRHRFTELYQASKAQRRTPANGAKIVTIDEVEPAARDHGVEMTFVRDELRLAKMALAASLSPLELRAFVRFANGYSYVEIAAELGQGHGKRAIDNALQRARRKAADYASRHGRKFEHGR